MIFLKNDTDPYFPYYYHDKKSQNEYLFLYGHDLENDSYVDEDFLYPYSFGTLLCILLNVINEIRRLIKTKKDESDNLDLSLEISKVLSKYLPEGKEYNTSIDELRMFMESELFSNDIKDSDYNSNHHKLINCFHYVELCARDKSYSNLECLTQFALLNALKLKNSFKAFNGIPIEEVDDSITLWEIKMYLDRLNGTDRFAFPENRQCYVDLFRLDSLCDLILISLSELFEMGKTINQCEICGKFFIPQRSDTKYCDGIFPDNENRTCREEAKLRKQLERVRLSETQRMYRSLSQMMREKRSSFETEGNEVDSKIANDELVAFQEKHKEMKAKYKKSEITEWEYQNWLRSFYKRRHK